VSQSTEQYEGEFDSAIFHLYSPSRAVTFWARLTTTSEEPLVASRVDDNVRETYIGQAMPIPGIDFGLFIAYILPGAVALYALSLVSTSLREFLRSNITQPSVGSTLIVAIMALAAGRMMSIGRAAFVDPTFAAALPWVSCHDAPQRGSIPAIAPDYRQMIDAGHREAYLLTVAGDQRQYQFCGNTALSVLLCLVCAVITLGRDRQRRAHLAWLSVACIVVVMVLYGGARASYYAFMRAVAQVNGFELVTRDHDNRPCQMTFLAK